MRHGSLPEHAPGTRRIRRVGSFQAPVSAACLRRTSRYLPVAPCVQPLHQAKFVPSWRNKCARMAQFGELAGTPGTGMAVSYWVPSVSPAYL